ncbi:MAG: fibronectin type III domain-containing protein [Bacteroidales bacterium]|nr:MAG: fibronectin type III domain-containing protein [Bacteroidales bacterium]
MKKKYLLLLSLILVSFHLMGQSYYSNDSLKFFDERLIPTIIELPVTDITSHSATINWIINPNGFATTTGVETPSSGPFYLKPLGNDTTNVIVTYTLNGLEPNTIYNFLIIAGNMHGFSTLPPTIDNVRRTWLSFTTLDKSNIVSTDNLIKSKNDSLKVISSNSIQQRTGPTENQIKIYEKNKTKLKQNIETLNHNINLLNSDLNYSKIDLSKINEAKIYFEDIDKKVTSSSQQEFKSINYLTEDLTSAIKILMEKRKFKKDTLFYRKYEYLIINIEELHEYLLNDKQSYIPNVVNDNKILLCCTGKSFINFMNIKEIQTLNIVGDCNFGDGVKVKIFAVQLDSLGNMIPRHNLTVNYKYALEIVRRHPPNRFAKKTSPSCEKVIPGKYVFWLTNSFIKNKKPISEIIEVDLTRKGKKLNENEIKSVEIAVTNK